MDLHSALPCASIFHELQTVHDTGFFYSLPSLEDDWAQVCFLCSSFLINFCLGASSMHVAFQAMGEAVWQHGNRHTRASFSVLQISHVYFIS